MTEQEIFLVPASNDQAYAHLTDTVIEGVPREDVENAPGSDDPVHVWGVKDRINEQQTFERGDILLFYTGEKMYTQAAVVRDTDHDEAVARDLWGIDDTDATQDTDPWRHLIYLDPPIEVAIEGEQIADFADYGMDYVLGLQPLNEQGHDAIVETFGSIIEFIADAAVDRDRDDVLARSPVLREVADEQPTAETADTPSTTAGFAASERWADRCDQLVSVFDRTTQVVLTGSPQTVSVGQARRLATAVLDDHPRDPDARILSVSIDESTTYEDFVERPITSPDAPTNVTTTDGPFKRACRLAAAAKNEARHEDEPIPDFMLLVDTTEASSLTDVLGQIAHVLKTRRREPTVQLPHSGETLTVPANLNILVVIERSADTQLSHSLRRHFRVLELPPDSQLLSEIYGYSTVDDAHAALDTDTPPIPALTVALHDILTTDSNSPLGHDLFIDYDATANTHDGDERPHGQYTDETLCDIWQYTVLPALRDTQTPLDDHAHTILTDMSLGTISPTPSRIQQLLGDLYEAATTDRSESAPHS
ncbi:hypothetical protein [Halarchaeum sp. P4]|uniref:hypothetical protein n=1 Tax=Halarchaeum sp. P4 TaxID=3421639 RepID=UPI003EBE6C66